MIAGGSGVLSIGALSAATGIPVETIRTWERRYGFPVAERKPSGHRVYPVSTVPRLRLINQALARGHRAAEVVPASEAVLEALLDALPAAPQTTSASKAIPTADPAALFSAVRAFDAEALKRTFDAEWARRGPLEFVEQVAAPFLNAIGEAWQQGDLDVRHEHFASAVLGDFLRTVRMPLDDRATGPLVALATLPGERHGLGLQMSALVFALAGWRTLMLGIETPPEQIVALTKEAPVGAVALSFVLPNSTVAAVRSLRRRIARDVPLLVGGAGVASEWAGAGIHVLPDLRALDAWVRGRT
jgi:DNA-binding transcriptional MerR regulator/methanogenic corrinoid protein MtbC1